MPEAVSSEFVFYSHGHVMQLIYLPWGSPMFELFILQQPYKFQFLNQVFKPSIIDLRTAITVHYNRLIHTSRLACIISRGKI